MTPGFPETRIDTGFSLETRIDTGFSPTGVTSVVDQLAVAKEVRVIEAAPAPTVIETRSAAPVIEVNTPVVVPPGPKVIVTP